MAQQIIVSQLPVSGFTMAAPELLDRIDLITELAARGAELAAGDHGVARLFREIGFLADAVVDGSGADLRAAWNLDDEPEPPPASGGPALPAFGAYLPEHGGVFAGIMRAPVDGPATPPQALIVATPDHEFGACWGQQGLMFDGADSRCAGRLNTQQMAAAGCKVARRVLGMRIEGFGDWHVPSLLELQVAIGNAPKSFDSNAILWTSTQTSADLAMLVNLEFAAAAWDEKHCVHRVRPVRLVPLSRVLGAIAGG